MTDCQTGEVWASHVLEAWEYAAGAGVALLHSPLNMPTHPDTCATPAPAAPSPAANATNSSSNSGSSSNSTVTNDPDSAACVAGWVGVWQQAVAALQAAGVVLVTADG